MNEPIVRGAGHAPGQSAGEPMPSIAPDTERGSLGDMRDHFARKNEEARAKAQGRPAQARQQPAATTTSGRIGEFSSKLEAQQQAVQQGETQEPATTGSDPNNPEAQVDPEQPLEQQEEQTEQAPPGEIDDATALQMFREWQSSDMFPEEMAEKWMNELTINGRRHYVNQKELKQGYIRGGDYRRLSSEANQHIQRAQATEQQMNRHFESVRNPEQMLEIYERNGYGDTLYEVAKLIGRRNRKERAIVEAAGYAAMHELGVNDPNDHRVQKAMDEYRATLKENRRIQVESRRLQFERDQFEQQQRSQQQQQETQQHQQTYERALSQLRPLTFKVHGIADTATHRAAFNRHLGMVIQTLMADRKFDGQITRDICMAAAGDLQQEIEDRHAFEQNQGQQPPRGMTPAQWQAQRARQGSGRALGPGRQGIGGGQPLGKSGNGQTRGSLQDLERMVRDARTGRAKQ